MLGNIWRVHDSNPWQNNFINGIQIHDQSPWFEPMAIYLSKAQFTLATSKPNSHWQHQIPIPIGNIKAQFSLAIFKAKFSLAISNQFSLVIFKTQFSLVISKPSSRWQYQKLNSHWQHQKLKLATWHHFIKSPRLLILGKILYYKHFT